MEVRKEEFCYEEWTEDEVLTLGVRENTKRLGEVTWCWLTRRIYRNNLHHFVDHQCQQGLEGDLLEKVYSALTNLADDQSLWGAF